MAATAGTESTEEKKKSQTYPGGCHCGYIRFEVTLSPPLDEQTVVDCNCSMCRRGGYLLVCTSKKIPTFERVTYLNPTPD